MFSVEKIQFLLYFAALFFPFFEGVHFDAVFEDVFFQDEAHVSIGGHDGFERRRKDESSFVVHFSSVFADEGGHGQKFITGFTLLFHALCFLVSGVQIRVDNIMVRDIANIVKFLQFFPLCANYLHLVAEVCLSGVLWTGILWFVRKKVYLCVTSALTEVDFYGF